MALFMTKGTLVSSYISTSRFGSRILSITLLLFLHRQIFAHQSFRRCSFRILSLFRISKLVNVVQTSLKMITLFPYIKIVTKWLYSSGNECNRIIALTSSLISSSRFFKSVSNISNLETWSCINTRYIIRKSYTWLIVWRWFSRLFNGYFSSNVRQKVTAHSLSFSKYFIFLVK